MGGSRRWNEMGGDVLGGRREGGGGGGGFQRGTPGKLGLVVQTSRGLDQRHSHTFTV